MSGVNTDHRVVSPASAALSGRSAETFGVRSLHARRRLVGHRHLPVDRAGRHDRHGPDARPARLQPTGTRAVVPRSRDLQRVLHRAGLGVRGARLRHARRRGRCGVPGRLPARAQPVGRQRLRLRAHLRGVRRPAQVPAPGALLRDPRRDRLPGDLHRSRRGDHRDRSTTRSTSSASCSSTPGTGCGRSATST